MRIINENRKVIELLKNPEINLIPVCPEQMGGLPTPRVPSEVQQDGRVMTKDGRDVSSEYNRGAEQVLKLAGLYDCTMAILKERSPACGHGRIYDGSFTGTLACGNGIAADLLIRNGIKVLGESELEQLGEHS